MSGIQSGGVRAATQQVEDALLQEYDQIAGGASKYALLAQKYGLDSESSFMRNNNNTHGPTKLVATQSIFRRLIYPSPQYRLSSR